MAVLTCTRRLEIDAGHRVVGHETKCKHLHGHRYVFEFTAQASLDDLGRVVDFGVVKERMGGWLDKHWDHGLILSAEDPHLELLQDLTVGCSTGPIQAILQKVYVLPWNPTAENMARYLAEKIWPVLFRHGGVGLELVRLVIHETPNCKATWEAA